MKIRLDSVVEVAPLHTEQEKTVILCPFCGGEHLHYLVEDGDLRFPPCIPMGKNPGYVIRIDNEELTPKIPIVPGYLFFDRGWLVKVRCPFCGGGHIHGAGLSGEDGEGRRIAHCYKGREYIIKIING